MIIENFREIGVDVNELYTSGGIPQKNPLMMQIYADVLNMPIYVGETEQGPALGSAIFVAVAAEKDRGGYDNVVDASKAMGTGKDKVYRPNKANVSIYDKLFNEYKKLHDYFGRGENNVMKQLKEIKENVSN